MRITSLFPKARLDSRDAAPPAPDDGNAEVRRLNDEYLAAMLAGDTGWFKRRLAGNAVVMFGDGRRLNKAEFLAMMRAQPGRLRSLEARDVAVRAFGPVVQVDADAPWELADGTRGMTRYLHTWIRLEGGWQVVSVHLAVVAR